MRRDLGIIILRNIHRLRKTQDYHLKAETKAAIIVVTIT